MDVNVLAHFWVSEEAVGAGVAVFTTPVRSISNYL